MDMRHRPEEKTDTTSSAVGVTTTKKRGMRTQNTKKMTTANHEITKGLLSSLKI